MVNLADFFFVSWLVCLWTTFFSDKTRFTCWTSVSSYRIRCAWHKTLQLLQLNFLLQQFMMHLEVVVDTVDGRNPAPPGVNLSTGA